MKHLFITYDLAKKLKEKVFDEPCICLYKSEDRLIAVDQHWGMGLSGICKQDGYRINEDELLAPMYQQVTDWFRDKHNLHFYITPYGDMRTWSLSGLEGWELPNITRIDKKERADRLFFDLRSKYQGVKFNTYYDALNTAIEEALKLI